MGAKQIKERLHLRIEQADDRLLRVLDQFAETLFTEYHIDEGQILSDEEIMALPAPTWAKPMTKEESLADIKEGLAEYHRGEYITLEQSNKEAETW